MHIIRVYIYIYIYTHKCVYIYIYTYLHTHTIINALSHYLISHPLILYVSMPYYTS